MSDHRRIQRSLFRMQLDGDFAAALRSGEAGAVASTGLGEPELAWLREADPAGLSADFRGRRRRQFLGNVAAEFLLTTWAAVQAEADPELVDSFPSSSLFHEAAAGDGSFPLAFAAHARQRAEAADDLVLLALIALESALAYARRLPVERPGPARGELVLSPEARLVELPSGTLDAAEALRAALDAGGPPPPPRLDASARETVLVVAARPRSGAGPDAHPVPRGRLAEVRAERLGELPAALARLAERPIDAASRRGFAREHEVEASELEEFCDSLVAEGVLRRG